jgi:hypothetical protein
MESIEVDCTTAHTERQIPLSARRRLIELGEAKIQLRKYRSAVVGSGKADAVSRLIDGIRRLEAAESVVSQ